VFLPEHAQEHASAVEKRVPVIEMRAAHGKVPGIHFAAHRERPCDRLGTPGVLIEFFERDRPVAARRADGNTWRAKSRIM